MIKEGTIKEGVRVVWKYTHHLNSKSKVIRYKYGVVLEITGKVKNTRYVSGTHCKVHFDGNKHPSTVPIKELEVWKVSMQ